MGEADWEARYRASAKAVCWNCERCDFAIYLYPGGGSQARCSWCGQAWTPPGGFAWGGDRGSEAVGEDGSTDESGYVVSAAQT